MKRELYVTPAVILTFLSLEQTVLDTSYRDGRSSSDMTFDSEVDADWGDDD